MVFLAKQMENTMSVLGDNMNVFGLDGCQQNVKML